MEMDDEEREMVAAGANVTIAPPVADAEEPIKIVKNYKRGQANEVGWVGLGRSSPVMHPRTPIYSPTAGHSLTCMSPS
eukprot:scaffold338958_cov22-Prasinocladus_malaysianus.AAC.1